MIKKFIIIIFLFYFIKAKITYSEIKRDETLYFTLENINSSFYAYLNCSNDYEPEENNYTLEHYLILEPNIKFKNIMLPNTKDFPDESDFNKSSNYSEPNYIDIDKTIILGSYPKCNKEQNNSIIYFVIYYDQTKYQDFNNSEKFIVKRLQFNPYITNDTQGIFDIELKANQINLYKVSLINPEYEDYESYGHILFINYPYSILFYKNSLDSTLIKYLSNANIYYFSFEEISILDDEDICELYFIIYNPYNLSKNINIEYKTFDLNKDYYTKYNSINMQDFEIDYSLYFSYFGVTCAYNNQSGLYKINSGAENYLFIDNIENIKNLTDLHYLGHYKYISEGLIYSPNNNFILLSIYTAGRINLKISKIILEEKGSQITDISFTYFKISQNNSLTFIPKYLNQSFIVKLLSNNNGTININNKNYYFEQNDLKIIEPINKNNIIIKAIDNNFDFGIKLKISDGLIDYGEIGKNYTSTNNTNYKFVIYKIDTKNNSIVNIDLKYETKYKECFNYEITSNLNEIQKRGFNTYYNQFFDLLPYKKNNNKNWYLFFYLENLTDFNINISISYNHPIPTSYEGIFSPIQNTEYISYCYSETYEFFNIIPCSGVCKIKYFQYGTASLVAKNTPFISYTKCRPYEYIILNDCFGFVSYQRFDNIQDFFGYNEEDSIFKSYLCFPIDINHIRINMSHLFSNASEINYTFVISPNNKNQNQYLFEPICNAIYYFFINQTDLLEAKDIEIYHFSLKDIKEDIQENQSFYYVDLPMPTKINPYGSNKPFKYKLIGLTGPKYIVPKIYSTLYLNTTICHHACLECDYIGDEKNQNCTACDINSKFKYLINSDDYGKNCVEKCPEGTILNEAKFQCIKNEKDKTSNYLLAIILGIVGFIILIISFVIIYLKCRKPIIKNLGKKEKILLNEIDSNMIID